jgi:bifunctional non-homologous end joining protein LigD
MLTLYNKKRNFKKTPEPSGTKNGVEQHRFVVQRHNASHLHYDFRLQMNGVLKSWAVPKGPSMNAADKRLAVQVEDHPVSYINFSGTIPTGNYGAGEVDVWDKGVYTLIDEKGNHLTDRQANAWLKKGELKFILKGKKLQGSFVLVQLKKDPKNWLLIKHRDEYAIKKNYDPGKDAPAVSKEKKAAKEKAAQIPAITKTGKLSHYYKPMLATPVAKAFDDKDWVFEIKWDGYRAIAECAGKELKFYSRNGLSFLNRYPTIASTLKKLKHKMVIDGEIVVLNDEGKPSFQLLQQYDEHPEYPIVYYVFDALFINNKDIRDLALTDRKALLKKALGSKKNGIIQYCDHITGTGISFFNKAVEMDLEGIMAKKAVSAYASGVRSKEWLKIKNHNTREAVIAGFTKPKGSRKHFGALILAEKRGQHFTYIGHTGTGFTEKILKELWQQMQEYITKASPFKATIKVNAPVTWLQPKLVCQVKFTERTADGMLRHPVYMGLRIDKKASEVKQSNETPEK